MTIEAKPGYEVRHDSGSSLAEFGPALFILLVIVLLPLIGFFSFADGVATVYFASSASARSAASASTQANATANMQTTANNIINTFGSFAGLNPRDATGLTLQVVQVPLAGGAPAPYTPPADTDSFLYEYQVTAKYTISPLFIPGGPYPVQFVTSSAVEHPEGLPAPAGSGGGS